VAKSAKQDLTDRLRAKGLRTRVAKTVSDAVGSGRRRATPPSQVRRIVDDLRGLANEIEDRATGGPAKRKAAAKKAAATRKRKAAARSTAAKKAARTRAKKS
jgi:hypothetical protein